MIAQVFIIAAALAIVAWIAWGNTALMVERFTVSSGRLPVGFSGFRIVHISDLHNAEFGDHNQELLQLISGNEPDIIVITGDLVDSNRTDVAVALDFGERAAKIAPVYYVTGNHEGKISEYSQLREGLEAAGVAVLENQALPLEFWGEKITLLGLSDPVFLAREDRKGNVPGMVSEELNELLPGETGSFTLLLSHRPELFETYVDCGIDLVFSGHAHGGQFRLPFVGGLVAPDQGLFPKYDAGLYTKERTTMVVSRGIGNSIIPFRVNNRPEVVVVTLEGKAPS